MNEPASIILQPEYVEHFQCDGKICGAKCCKNYWYISIDTNTYNKYKYIQNKIMKKKILSSMEKTDGKNEYHIKFDEEGACPLICSDKLCYIQRNLGAEALSLSCQVYPRMVQHVGACQLRTLSMTCPVAAEAALFSEHGMNIKSMSNIKNDASWKIALKRKKLIDDIDTDIAISVILGSLSILQNTYYTFEQRMIILGLFLDKADDLKSLPNSAEAISELALFYNSDDFQPQIQDIFDNWVFYPTAHGQLLTGILNFLQEKKTFWNVSLLVKQAQDYDKNAHRFSKLTQSTFGEAIDRYWQQEFIYHGIPFFRQGNFLHNYFAYLIAYKIWEMYLYGFYYAYDGKINKDDFMNLVTRYSKKLDHINNFVDYLVKYTAPFEKEPIKLMQVLLRLN